MTTGCLAQKCMYHRFVFVMKDAYKFCYLKTVTLNALQEFRVEGNNLVTREITANQNTLSIQQLNPAKTKGQMLKATWVNTGA